MTIFNSYVKLPEGGFLLRHLGSGPVFSAPWGHQTLQQASNRAARERCMQQRKERHRHEKYAVTQITQKLLKYHQCCHCLHNLGLLSWDKRNSCRYVQLWPPQTLRTAAFKRDSSFAKFDLDLQATFKRPDSVHSVLPRNPFGKVLQTIVPSIWPTRRRFGHGRNKMGQQLPRVHDNTWGGQPQLHACRGSPNSKGLLVVPGYHCLVRGIWVFDGK